MATYIIQKPLYGDVDNGAIPVGQQVVFSVEDAFQVQNRYNVKYVAEVHIGTSAINLSVATQLVASFKTTPNNAGVGIFDLQSILEGYVSSDNLGSTSGNGSTYKGVTYTNNKPHPIHLIDKYARNRNAVRFFAIQFSVESSTTPTSPVIKRTTSVINSAQYIIFNGVLQYDNYLTQTNANYGYNLSDNLLYTAKSTSAAKFLTNSPTTQYANVNDYGVLSFLNCLPASTNVVRRIYFYYYDSLGNALGNEDIYNSFTAGGADSAGSTNVSRLLYFGAFPGNLQNWSSTFQGLVSAGTIQGGYYTVQAINNDGELQQLYTINVNCPNSKGYESIRLTWLNQWGVSDYYTFTMKSTKSLTTNRTTYTQMSGTWNDSTYRINGFKGGKKNFRVNSTERITVNTDFVTEADAVWFEELINSQEVYVLNGYETETAPYNTMTNKYVEPILITSSNYIRKTIANDKLIQYTFEMERNKTQKTQTS